MSEFEILATGFYLEGLAVRDETVWYSDVVGGGIHRVEPRQELEHFLTERLWTGGILIAADGSILSSGRGGIMQTDPGTAQSAWLIENVAGKPVNGVNEFAVDGSRGFYFGTVDLDSIAAGKRPGLVGIFHRAADGTVRELCNGLGFTNGMALSPDGRTLYCNESFDGTYAHDVAADGSLSGRRQLLNKPDCDGMALDVDGNLWITGFSSSEIVRITSDGTVLEPFPTPAEAVTQIRFGGADMRDLYLTTVPIDAGAELATGEMTKKQRSRLLKTRSPVAGYSAPLLALD